MLLLEELSLLMMIKEIKYYDGKGTFLEERNYEYKFDDKGNWVERIEYINQFPKGFLEREITYYP